MTAPVRGQRRRGTPSLVLPGDPDGCGWFALGGGEYVPFPSPPTGHPARERRTVRYVGRPSHWGNRAKVVDDWGLGVRFAVMVDGPGFCEGIYAGRAAANKRAAWVYESSSYKWIKDEPIKLARYLAPLVTADALSCWCPLDAPCHADTLCDLVGRLRSGDLVPGLVATPDMCGGALRVDGTRLTVEWVCDALGNLRGKGVISDAAAFEVLAADYIAAPEMVRVAARVGGAL